LKWMNTARETGRIFVGCSGGEMTEMREKVEWDCHTTGRACSPSVLVEVL